ncbi:MAG: hypothetical protein QMD97_02455 [Candidatus Aenigmarchaeota archaeon]|nr:hypothetical protein [Candidatus Aenigmarchaeota archaeon]
MKTALKMTKGKCGYCFQMISGSDIDNHITTCIKSPYRDAPKSKKGGDVFLIGVQCADLPLYWMFVEAKTDAALEKLDQFLRKTWLECCGHLSRFVINGVSYEIYRGDDDDYGEESMTMKVPMGKILGVGKVFHHEYDYGTTTYLQLKVFAMRHGTLGKPIIHVARNEPPEWKCAFCKNPATEVCGICGLGTRTVLCQKCLARHSCTKEEGMALPLVNSPRTGQCGYTGQRK